MKGAAPLEELGDEELELPVGGREESVELDSVLLLLELRCEEELPVGAAIIATIFTLACD